MSEGRSFLARWSRLKKAAETASTAEIPDAEAMLAQLGPDSDFGLFLREEVSEAVRRKAMKTLFADPHFNVMDGLDIYIDDYSISDPIPDEMMATLNHAKTLFETPDLQEVPVPDGCDILAVDGQNVADVEPASPGATENQSLGTR